MTRDEARQVIKSRLGSCPISEQEKAGILFCQSVYELVEPDPIRSLASVFEAETGEPPKGERKAKEIEKTCVACGETFTARSAAAKYCKKCVEERKKATRRKYAAKRREDLADQVASIEETASMLAAMDME